MSRGARGLLPAMYAALEASLVRHARSVADAAAAGDRDGAAAAATAPLLRLRHYRRPGWTYHAKGLWLWPAAAAEVVGGGVRRPQAGEGEALAGGAGAQGDAACFDASGPVATLVGSSNFGERSARRDLELSCVIVATDPGVRRRATRRDPAEIHTRSIHSMAYDRTTLRHWPFTPNLPHLRRP
jgi:CDP-diacylglycerol--glycerol-3-phosphate 3-phosphatidyltransferase